MTKSTLIEKLSEAITNIENGTLHPEVEARDSFIEEIQDTIGRIEDGECYDDFGWGEDAIPDYMVDCIIDNAAEDLYLAQLRVDNTIRQMAVNNAKYILASAILFMALYN